MSTQPRQDSPATVAAPDDLAAIVARSAQAQQIALDEHYELTAFVLQRQSRHGDQTLIVEVLDRGADRDTDRWAVNAYDELSDQTIGPTAGRTAQEAIEATPWADLSDATPQGN